VVLPPTLNTMSTLPGLYPREKSVIVVGSCPHVPRATFRKHVKELLSQDDQCQSQEEAGRAGSPSGGTSGLGIATGKRIARTGAHITIADIDVSSGTRVATDIQQ